MHAIRLMQKIQKQLWTEKFPKHMESYLRDYFYRLESRFLVMQTRNEHNLSWRSAEFQSWTESLMFDFDP